jgi:hypothetical protein
VRTSAVRRTALAASAAALALLATACGGSGDEDKGGDSEGKADSTASAAPAAKALTAAELEKAGLVQADVKSGKVATKVAATDDIAEDQVKTDDAACLPLAHAQAGVAQGEPAATVKRSWTGEPVKPSEGTSPEDALLASLDLDKMLINLASVGGETLKIVKVATTAAPEGGDEGAAVTLTVAAEEGVKAPSKIVVVRKGATLASFSAVNLASMGTGEDFDVPAEVVDAQLAKLG